MFDTSFDAVVLHDGRNNFRGPCLIRQAPQSVHFSTEGGKEGEIDGHSGPAGCFRRANLFVYGMDQEPGCSQNIVKGVVRRLVAAGEEAAQSL